MLFSVHIVKRKKSLTTKLFIFNLISKVKSYSSHCESPLRSYIFIKSHCYHECRETYYKCVISIYVFTINLYKGNALFLSATKIVTKTMVILRTVYNQR